MDGSEGRHLVPAANENMPGKDRLQPRVHHSSELFEQQTISLANYQDVRRIYASLKMLAEQKEAGVLSLAEVDSELRRLAEKFCAIRPLNEKAVRSPEEKSAPSADVFTEFKQLLELKNRQRLGWHIARFSDYIKETERDLRLESDRVDGLQSSVAHFDTPNDGPVTEHVTGPDGADESSGASSRNTS